MSGKVIALIQAGRGGPGFRSATEELICPLLGKPLVFYVLESVARLNPQRILLALDETTAAADGLRTASESVARKKIPLRTLFSGPGRARAGTGLPAILQAAAPELRKYPAHDVLLVPADRPLLRAETLRKLLLAHRRQRCAMTVMACGPDLESDQVAVFRARDILGLMRRFAPAAKKFSISKVAALLSSRGLRVGLAESPGSGEDLRVAGRPDIARAAAELRRRKQAELARGGVTLLDPALTWIDWEVTIGRGTVVSPLTVIEGATRIGKNCRVHPHVHIMNSRLGEGAAVLSSSVLEGAVLEPGCQVGPFTRLRPGTVVQAGAKVGNFVEMKNTVFGPRSKAMHLTYLGDTRVEGDVNIGAGTITCNYDGVRKNPTEIGAGAFIGSGTELVAPVRVGKKAYIAAGSTITKDVAPGSLAIGRARQVEKPGWVLERVKRIKTEGRRPK